VNGFHKTVTLQTIYYSPRLTHGWFSSTSAKSTLSFVFKACKWKTNQQGNDFVHWS